MWKSLSISLWHKQLTQQHDQLSTSMSKWIYIAQFHTEHLNCARCTSIWRQDRVQGAPKDTVAHGRFMQVDRQCIPDGQTPTEKAHQPSVLRRYRRMIKRCRLADRRCRLTMSAVDQIPWCFVLQTPTDHDSQLVLHAFRNVEPEKLVVNQHWQTAVVLVASVGDEAGRRIQDAL